MSYFVIDLYFRGYNSLDLSYSDLYFLLSNTSFILLIYYLRIIIYYCIHDYIDAKIVFQY